MILHQAKRMGVSLIELLVVIAIVTVLIGLLLGGIQAVRQAAIKMKSANKLRQIAIATQNYSSANDDQLPCYGIKPVLLPGTFDSILPYLEQSNATIPYNVGENVYVYVAAYQSPADPTLQILGDRSGDCSYAANYQSFQVGSNLMNSFPDGTSNTIAFVERYATCRFTPSKWDLSNMTCSNLAGNTILCTKPTIRRPTFADPIYDDVMPVLGNNNGTQPSIPGLTFQIMPSTVTCDYRIPQTPHASGMLTALVDGSVRSISGTISPSIFWSAVTPAGGEVSQDW